MNTGPGGYSPRTEKIKLKDPVWSFGKQKKGQENCSDLPGPGNYDTKFSFNKKLGIFGKHSRNNGFNNSVPGPGNYESNSLFSDNVKKNKGTTLFSKYDASEGNKNPGPSDYTHESLFKKN